MQVYELRGMHGECMECMECMEPCPKFKSSLYICLPYSTCIEVLLVCVCVCVWLITCHRWTREVTSLAELFTPVCLAKDNLSPRYYAGIVRCEALDCMYIDGCVCYTAPCMHNTCIQSLTQKSITHTTHTHTLYKHSIYSCVTAFYGYPFKRSSSPCQTLPCVYTGWTCSRNRPNWYSKTLFWICVANIWKFLWDL